MNVIDLNAVYHVRGVGDPAITASCSFRLERDDGTILRSCERLASVVLETACVHEHFRETGYCLAHAEIARGRGANNQLFCLACHDAAADVRHRCVAHVARVTMDGRAASE
jgi:hypothetical protein